MSSWVDGRLQKLRTPLYRFQAAHFRLWSKRKHLQTECSLCWQLSLALNGRAGPALAAVGQWGSGVVGQLSRVVGVGKFVGQMLESGHEQFVLGRRQPTSIIDNRRIHRINKIYILEVSRPSKTLRHLSTIEESVKKKRSARQEPASTICNRIHQEDMKHVLGVRLAAG